ncbi:hypothetical protein QF035_006250 [Streptomyces umbrinus]|uniref:Restriction endonuclease domain-containing protein n=1 Tax=Streptomyces umbrinus TaxID=67370 RepID=A0ABU0SYP6_9ACTN|nr:hypothetical protein [Streptomyces umbrinus]
MTTRQGYRTMRSVIQALDDTLPGKFELTKEGIIHDLTAPNGPHELTRSHLRKRLEKVMQDGIVAHTGTPDVENEPERIMRRPDVMLIATADMEGDGAFDPHTLIAAIEVVSRSNPDNDMGRQDARLRPARHPDLRDLRSTHGRGSRPLRHPRNPERPRYATRKDFVHGEDVTIGDWTISTENLPRYADKDRPKSDPKGNG